jgi:non-specific serine/threonine protein kinase
LLSCLRYRKSQSVLALLALRASAEVERDWLAALLWPESTGTQALRNCLTDLRHALGPQASRLRSRTPHTVGLDLTGAAVDVLAFDAALARASAAGRGNEAATDSELAAALTEAVTLYRGPLLEGCAEEWAFQERQAREQAYLAARERLAALALEAGETAEAERHLRLAVAVDPLRESTQRALMQALAAGGNYAAALLCYRELRQRLHRELNTTPDPETQTLFQQLRSEARRLSAKGAVGRWASHTTGSGRSEAPVDTTFRHQLPLPLTRFIGREDQLAELQQWLAEHRLVTLTGAGGCGKTRLALAVATELLAAFPDGVTFVDLASLADPGLVPQAVATALGLKEAPGRPPAEVLRDFLQPRHLLLVLDNCEHLLAACAGLAHTMLQGCPRLRVLATSREALGITGERAYRTPPLSVPGVQAFGRSGVQADPNGRGFDSAGPDCLSARTPERLLQYEAVRLFTDRAMAVLPSFQVSSENVGAVAQICRRLEGMPLAIELAAVRMSALPVETIAAGLDDMFRLLTRGCRTALPRQQTLRATLDWSYNLLSEPERTLLPRLSVFAGGWTLEAAEAVCAEDGIEAEELLDRLTSLVEKSLVLYGNSEAPGGGGRYRLLETVRQYARDRLRESGETARVRDRHFDFFLRLAEQAEPELHRHEQVEWLDRLDVEHDNVRAALAWCLTAVDSGQWLVVSPTAQGPKADLPLPEPATNHHPLSTAVEKGLRLGGAVFWFWVARGYLGEGREQLARLLAPGALGGAKASSGCAARAKALHGAGILAMFQGDYGAARTRLEESMAISRELGNRREAAWSLGYLGKTMRFQGDGAAARALFEESLAIFREVGSTNLIAWSLGNLGDVARDQGDCGTARPLYEESLALFREVGNKRAISGLLDDLGMVALDQGDHDAARALMAEALTISWEVGHQGGLARDLSGLAAVAIAQAQFERAARLFGALAALREAIGHPLAPADRAGYERSLAAVRAGLGEAAFAAAWEEGRAMRLEQAVRLALEDDE